MWTMTPFTEKVVTIIAEIPSGKVMTYGQIAKLAGSKRAARQVVRVLHSVSQKYNLPWHRVVNSKGYVGISGDQGALQRTMLAEEGIKFQLDNSINLKEFGYEPIHLVENEYM